MKIYTVHYAEDVPHYGILDIEAKNDATVIETAKSKPLNGITIDADYENSACKRIVQIQDDAGNLVAADIPLDDCYLRYGGEPERKLCDVAPDLLKTLQDIAAIPLYGEPLPESMAALKADLIVDHEYDEEDQTYTPNSDSESEYLRWAVEIARAVLLKAKGGAG